MKDHERETSVLALALPVLQLSSHSLLTAYSCSLTAVAIIICPSSIYYPQTSEEINPYLKRLDICSGMAEGSLWTQCLRERA